MLPVVAAGFVGCFGPAVDPRNGYAYEIICFIINLFGVVEIVVEHPFEQVVVEHLLAVVVVVAYIALKKNNQYLI